MSSAADTTVRDASQEPDWPDPDAVRRTADRLRTRFPLVAAAECDRLRSRLAEVAAGRAFLLQGGDCAERFAIRPGDVERKLETLLQIGAILTCALSMPVVKIGRMAGQYSKPRSKPTEVREGVKLPAYRGDSVNTPEFTPQGRRADPVRLERMYDASARTLAVLRSAGEWSDPARARESIRCFVRSHPDAGRYWPIAADVDRALEFLTDWDGGSGPRGAEVFASHEALLLDYERALTRPHAVTAARYGLSGHLLWIGDRTRAVGGDHVEFATGIRNPVAVKIGPSAGVDDVLALVDRLDPEREPGRLTLITRLGAGQLRRRLPELVARVTADGGRVAWVCDPMHGNTFEAPSGHKTRRFDDVLDELCGFFDVHRELGTHPGGVHLEFTGDEVTECIGGGREVFAADLHHRYETACDPRLSRGQALDLAFLVAELHAAGRGPGQPSSGSVAGSSSQR
jgi:3-deoxy-7-phosphoheptulonate synthase